MGNTNDSQKKMQGAPGMYLKVVDGKEIYYYINDNGAIIEIVDVRPNTFEDGFYFETGCTVDSDVNVYNDDFSKNESDENINKNESKSNEEIDDNETFELYNSNISYILIKTLLVEDTDKKAKGITLLKMNMYAITGGRGYLIISEFIEKNFGLNLVPRLIKTKSYL